MKALCDHGRADEEILEHVEEVEDVWMRLCPDPKALHEKKYHLRETISHQPPHHGYPGPHLFAGFV